MNAITIDNIEDVRGQLTLRAGDLAFDMWQIFDRAAFDSISSCILAPVSRLVSPKNHLTDPRFLAGERPDARQTAYLRMLDAAAGRLAPRRPITARQGADGRLTIIDGNATAQVLMLVEWPEVPVEIV